MAGQSGLDGDLRGFLIAHLADQDNIRVLPHEGLQSVHESIVCLDIYLGLLYSGDMVFDRIFNRDYFYFRGTFVLQKSVQSRGFSGPGRTGIEDHPVRPVQLFFHDGKVVVAESEIIHAQIYSVRIKNAHDNDFAELGRSHRDAHFNILFSQADSESSILRLIPDIELQTGKKFYPGNNLSIKRTFQVGKDIVQISVYPVTELD